MDLGGVWGNFGSSIAGGAGTFFTGLVAAIVISFVGYFLYKGYKNITFYKTPISLTILLENGMEQTRHDIRGGAFWNKGIRDFKIKIPKQRKPHILGYMPDFSKSSTSDNRLCFITMGDRTIWQQYESTWVLKGKKTIGENEFEYDLVNKPVPVDTKRLTVNSIKNWRDTIDKSKLTAFGIAIGAFIIMVIAHLVSLFIQTKIRCGAG